MRTSASLVTALLITPVFAQDPAAPVHPKAPTQAISALTITTSDADVARNVLQSFGSAAELPELGEGDVVALVLDDGGKLITRPGTGTTWLKIEARPAELMELFAPQVAQGRQMAQMMMGAGLGQAGFEFEDIDAMVNGLFAFPKQIDALSIVIPNEFEPGQGQELTIDVDLQPKAETWLAKLTANLRQNDSKVAVVPSAGSPMFSAVGNIDAAAVKDQLMPLIAMFAGIGQDSKEGKAEAARMMKSSYEAQSGTASFVFDFQNGGKGLMGLSNAAKMTELLQDPAYLELTKLSSEASGMAEAKVEAAAFTHRDVPVTKTTVIYDDPQMSPFGEDEQVTYMAVAGDLLIMTMMAGAKAEAQALIDAALDETVQHLSLPANVLARADVDIGAVMNFLAEQGVPADADDAPSELHVAFQKVDTGLQFKVRIK